VPIYGSSIVNNLNHTHRIGPEQKVGSSFIKQPGSYAQVDHNVHFCSGISRKFPQIKLYAYIRGRNNIRSLFKERVNNFTPRRCPELVGWGLANCPASLDGDV
jgi:hypothetical protein